ncbi:MAG: hypothetical protein R3B96_10010 [Pirellulaceae bacterium]
MGHEPSIGRLFDWTIGESPTAAGASDEIPGPADPGGPAARGRPFVGVRFLCCGTYARIYMTRTGDAYQGNCPRCSQVVRLEIGPGGSDARFFEVG